MPFVQRSLRLRRFIIARLVQMPEASWAGIATLVVMQSSLGATLTLSIERIAATAVGASVGALEANYFRANLAHVRGFDFSRRIIVVRVSFGKDRLPLCEHYAYYHRSNSALRSAMGDRFA
jgi:hypothetical protein